jgi:hypothetical protein
MHLFNDDVHSNQFLFMSKRDRLKWSGEKSVDREREKERNRLRERNGV